MSLYLLYSLGLMRSLCYDQPETLTQGYYPHVDSMVINAAPRRIPAFSGCCRSQTKRVTSSCFLRTHIGLSQPQGMSPIVPGFCSKIVTSSSTSSSSSSRFSTPGIVYDSHGRTREHGRSSVNVEVTVPRCLNIFVSQGSLLLMLGPLIGMPFLSTPMVAAHTYVSAR